MYSQFKGIIMSAPLYMQIKQFILDKIDSGDWMVGQRIATEIELTEQFGVSRMTVNKAIRDLVNEGNYNVAQGWERSFVTQVRNQNPHY